MSSLPSSSAPPRWTIIQSLVCLTAAIGFAFDTYELLMLPLIAPAAILEMTGAAPGTPESLGWIRTLFFVPAIAGSFFGLLGGWLTDRLGRRRVLTGSILLYAGSAFVAGFSTSMNMLLICRCLVFIGVCVEFVAAVAWLAELFDDPRQRERVIGYTQFFGSFGGLMVAFVNHEFAAHAADLPTIVIPEWAAGLIGTLKNPDPVWRFTIMSGLFPALPLMIIRPFLPESPQWQLKKQAGALKRPSLRELFTPELRRTTIISTLLVGCGFGMAFGALQQIPSIVRELPELKQRAANILKERGDAAAQLAPSEAKKAQIGAKKEVAALMQKEVAIYSEFQEVGGLFGRFLLAFLALRIVSRRGLLALFIVPCLFYLPLLFYGFSRGENPEWFSFGGLRFTLLTVGTFFAGALVIGQFSFWGNYLPRVFPLHLRGTGESMAANIGGRLMGTSFAWVTATLAAQAWMPHPEGTAKLAFVAACVVGGLGLAACLLLGFLPEPPAEERDDSAASAAGGS